MLGNAEASSLWHIYEKCPDPTIGDQTGPRQDCHVWYHFGVTIWYLVTAEKRINGVFKTDTRAVHGDEAEPFIGVQSPIFEILIGVWRSGRIYIRYADSLSGLLLRQTFFGHWMVLCDWGIIRCFTSISDPIVKDGDCHTEARICCEIMEKPRHWMVEDIFECPYNPFKPFLSVQHWRRPQIYFYGWWLEISICKLSLLNESYSPYRVLICFRPASRMAWPRRPHRSYLSLVSSRRSMPSLSITKPFRQTSRISHTWLAAHHLAENSDHQSPDGLQRASRYCLRRDDEISSVKTYLMPT